MVKRNPNLPQELLIEIFSRLPAKSVGKCRCLSKSWRTNLSTAQFIKSHLNHRKTQEENLILDPVDVTTVFKTVTPPITDDVVSKELDVGVELGVTLGSCNGLILFETFWYHKLFLVNPVTKEKIYIPRSKVRFKNYIGRKLDHLERGTGFGYDSSTNDYKIVILSIYLDMGPRGPFESVEVCSLKSGVWRQIDGPGIYVPCSFGAFVGGATHWLVGKGINDYSPSTILAFDLSDEVFRFIPSPATDKSKFNDLSILGGCLSMLEEIKSSSGFCFHVWVMKEYGLVDSWTKYFVDLGGAWKIRAPLCFIGDKKEILFITQGEEDVFVYEDVVVYDLEKETTKRMLVDGDAARFSGGVTFVDSLVSPSQHENM